MLRKTTKVTIKERNWLNHANPTMFFKRIKVESNDAIEDLALIASKFPEEELEKIFTVEKLEPLIKKLLKPRNKRTVLITEMLAHAVSMKLLFELPHDLVEPLKGDIMKTWIYANFLANYADKPLLKQK